MALTLEMVNGNADGTLDGVHATATVTGATGAVTFAAGPLHPEFLAGATVAAVDKGAGVYELTMPDGQLFWVTVTDTEAAKAYDPVWVWMIDLGYEEEVANALQLILQRNVPAIKKRMAVIDPAAAAKNIPVVYGMPEEIEALPAIAFHKMGTQSVPNSTSFDRRYTAQFTIMCFAYRLDDPTTNEALIGAMGISVRDMLLRYAHLTLTSGLKWSAGMATDIEFMDAMGPDNKRFGMAQMEWSCQTDYAIPSGF